MRKDAAASYKQAMSILPYGLQVLGVLCVSKTPKPEWPKEVPAEAHGLLLATRAEDGQLKAWDMREGQERGPWKVAEPSEICIYSSLDIGLPKARAQAQLTSIAYSLEEVRFRFPGTQLLPSVADLREGKVNVPWKLPAHGPVAVEVLAEALGSDRCSNFLEFQCHAPRKHRIDFAAYVPSNSSVLEAAEALLHAASSQIACLTDEVAAQREDSSPFAVRCFLLEHVVCLQRTEEQRRRQELHQLLRLPEEPLLVPHAALPLAGQANCRKVENSFVLCIFESHYLSRLMQWPPASPPIRTKPAV